MSDSDYVYIVRRYRECRLPLYLGRFSTLEAAREYAENSPAGKLLKDFMWEDYYPEDWREDAFILHNPCDGPGDRLVILKEKARGKQ